MILLGESGVKIFHLQPFLFLGNMGFIYNPLQFTGVSGRALVFVNLIEISSSTVWKQSFMACGQSSTLQKNAKTTIEIGKEQHVSSCFNIFPKCWFGAVFVTADSKRCGHQRFSKHVYTCIYRSHTHTDIMDSDVISLEYSCQPKRDLGRITQICKNLAAVSWKRRGIRNYLVESSSLCICCWLVDTSSINKTCMFQPFIQEACPRYYVPTWIFLWQTSRFHPNGTERVQRVVTIMIPTFDCKGF